MQKMLTEFSRLRELACLPLDEKLAEELGYSLRTLYRWERGEQAARPVVLHNLEAIIQGRGQGGERQAPNDLIMVSGNGGVLAYHSTLVLSPEAA